MSDFHIVENNELFFVVDAGGHALHTADDEKSAKVFMKQAEKTVADRIKASKDAARSAPR